MAITGKTNIVRFVPYDGVAGGGRYVPTPQRQDAAVYMTMDGEFVLTPGITANVNSFRVPWQEFDKLHGKPDRSGRLELFYNTSPLEEPDAAPDCIVEWMSIVDVEAIGFGYPLLDDGTVGAYRITSYRIHVADRRHRFSPPRGGVLKQGVVNATGMADPLANRRLIELCLDAMGIRGDCDINGDPNARAQVWDLEWRGNSAPEELGRILKEIDWVMVVRLDGSLCLEPRGCGATPTLPAEQALPEIESPGIPRVGTVVVFSSAPNAVIVTETIAGPSDTTWQFVALDSDKKWKPHHELLCLGASSAVSVVRGEAQVYPTTWAWSIRDDLFRRIRLSPARYPGRLLAKTITSAGQARDAIVVEAMIATQATDGTWHNNDDWVKIPASYIHVIGAHAGDGSILEFPVRLGRVVADGVADLDSHFMELTEGQLRVSVSYEAVRMTSAGLPDLDDRGCARPRYFEVGFRRNQAGQVVQLTPEELETALLDPDTIVISRPDWIDIEVNGQSTLGDQMTAVAAGTAEMYLRSLAKPTIMAAVGFCDVILSGSVTELRIVQTPPKMVLKIDHWHLPAEALRADRWKSSLSGSGKFPRQSQVSAERATLSASGSPAITQPLLPRAGAVRTGSNSCGGGITEMRYDDTLHSLQYRIGDGPWITVRNYSGVDVVIDVADDGDQLTQTKQRVYVPEAGGQADSAIAEIEAC